MHCIAASITQISNQSAQSVPVKPSRLLQMSRSLLECEHHVWPPRYDVLHLANDLPVSGVQFCPDVLLIVLGLWRVLDPRCRCTSSTANMQTCMFRNVTDALDIPFLRHLHEPKFGAPEPRAQKERKNCEATENKSPLPHAARQALLRKKTTVAT